MTIFGKKINKPISRIIGWTLSLAMLLSSAEGAGAYASALSEEFAEEYAVESAGNCAETSDYAETIDYSKTGDCAEESVQLTAGEGLVSDEVQESAAHYGESYANGAMDSGLIDGGLADGTVELGSDGAGLIEDISDNGDTQPENFAGDPVSSEAAGGSAGNDGTENTSAGITADWSAQEEVGQTTGSGTGFGDAEGVEELETEEDLSFLFADENDGISEESIDWADNGDEEEDADALADSAETSDTDELDPEGLIEDGQEDVADDSDPADWFDENLEDTFELENPMVVNPDGTVSGGSSKRRLMKGRQGTIYTNYGDQLSAPSRTLYDSRVANYYERRGSSAATGSYRMDFTEDTSIWTFTVDLSNAASLRSTDEYQEAYGKILGICQSAQDAFFYDYPQVFWTRSSVYSLGYGARMDSETQVATYWVSSLVFTPQEAFDNAFSYVSQLDTKVEEVAGTIEASADYNLDGVTTDNELVQRIHDYIAARCTYADTALDEYNYANKGGGSMTSEERAAYLKYRRRIFTPAAVFFDFSDSLGLGVVCEGYARSLKILCDYFDIPCMCIGGKARESSTIGHMWNYVQVDGTWQLVDATWDDTDDNLKYQYFLVDDLTTSGRLPSGSITAQNQKRTISDPDIAGASYTISYSPQVFTLPSVHTDLNDYQRSNTDENARCIGYNEFTCSKYGSKYWVATGNAPLGHITAYDETVSYCTQDVLTERNHCERCGAVLTKQLPSTALGHNFVEQDGVWKCSRCGKEQVAVSELLISTVDAQAWTGQSIHPTFTVYDGDYLLTEGVHYSVSYGTNIDSGEGSFTVTGIGIYKGEAECKFAIAGELSDTNTTLDLSFAGNASAATFDGTPQVPTCTVTYLGRVLDPRYYSVTCSDNIHAGDAAQVVVEGKEPYSGSVTGSFSIMPGSLKDLQVTKNIKLVRSVYTGSPLEPKTSVSYVNGDGQTVKMTEGKDYTVSFENNVNAGKGKLTVTGMNDFTGSYSGYFTIHPKVVTFEMGALSDTYYTGSAQTPEPDVWVESAGDIQKDTDYTLSYEDNLLPGLCTVTATGIGNYEGSTGSTTFTILGTPILVEAESVNGISYDGAAVEKGVDFDVQVFLFENKTKGEEITGVYTGTVDAPGFTYQYRSSDAQGTTFTDGLPKEAGNYMIRVTASEDTIHHRGSAFREFALTIAPKVVTFNLGSLSNTYCTGDIQTPEPDIWVESAGDVQKDTDYMLSYTGNLNPGTCTVTATGIGNYMGSTGSTTFTILEMPVQIVAAAETLIGSDDAPVREGEDFHVHVFLYPNGIRGEEVTDDYTGTGGAGLLTYQYRRSDAAETDFVDGLPKDVGSYVIRVTAGKDSVHHRTAASTEFALSIVQGYPVTWMNGSVVLETDTGQPEGKTPSFNGSDPVKSSTAQYSYSFTGWATEDGQETGSDLADLPTVSGKATYYAAFSKTVNKYTVQFVDGFGNTLKTETVEYGAAASAPGTPHRDGYAFAGWDRSFTNVTGALTVTAKWKIVISNAAVTLSGSEFTYNGSVQRPAVLTIGGRKLTEGTDYSAAWSNASSTDAGNYKVSITGKGDYVGTTSASYRILKAQNPMTVKGKTAKVKADKLNKKAQSLAVGKVMKMAGAKGAVSYKLVSVKKAKYKKYFKVNAKSGKVTVKKGLKKGTYKLQIAVTAAGDANYESLTQTVTCTVKVTK